MARDVDIEALAKVWADLGDALGIVEIRARSRGAPSTLTESLNDARGASERGARALLAMADIEPQSDGSWVMSMSKIQAEVNSTIQALLACMMAHWSTCWMESLNEMDNAALNYDQRSQGRTP